MAISRRHAIRKAVNKVALTPIGSLEPVHVLCIAEPFACLILEGVAHATSREDGRQNADKQTKDGQETMQTTYSQTELLLENSC